MKVVLDGDVARLEDADVFGSFALVVRGGDQRGGERLAQRLGALGVPSGDVEVDLVIDAITALPGARRDDSEWMAGFAAMLGYARTRGWVDDDAGTVRAHCEWEQR